MHIVPFSEEHLDGAAELLAARQQLVRARLPALPARFEQAAETRAALQAVFATPETEGVAALHDGRVLGFLFGTVVLPEPLQPASLFVRPRSVVMPSTGMGAAADGGYDAYRELYAALAPRWLARGCFSHYAQVPAGDETAEEAWFSLGFGQYMAYGVRDLNPVTGPIAAGLEMREAGTEDLDEVMAQVIGLYRYHAGPPMFMPYLPETEPEVRRRGRDLLENPTGATWLAYRDGRAVGIQEFRAPGLSEPMFVPENATYLQHGFTLPGDRGGGVGTALLAHSLDWARGRGFEHMTINWFTSNILGARFWERSGFRPISVRLYREVDPRIAWAH